MGALAVGNAVQPVGVSPSKPKIPPVASSPVSPVPPHTYNALPLHTAVASRLGAGAPAVGNATHVFATGLYSPPSFNNPDPFNPPHTTIRVPVHAATCPRRAVGAPVVAVADHWPVPTV